MDIVKLSIHEIEEYLEDSSPMLGLPSFKDLFRITAKQSYFRVMRAILRNSLRDLDRKSPLYMSSTIYADKDGSYEFVDNFDLYLKGELGFEYVTLKATSVVNVGGTLLNMPRDFGFVNGKIDGLYTSGKVYLEYLARHPYVLKKSETEDEFTDDSAIYGVAMDNDFISDKFLDIIMFNVINYLIELKTQVNFTEIPVEIYSGLMDKKSELDNSLNEFFLSNTTYSHLWR